MVRFFFRYFCPLAILIHFVFCNSTFDKTQIKICKLCQKFFFDKITFITKIKEKLTNLPVN